MYMKANLNHFEWSLQNSSICALEILASFPENFYHQLPFLKLKYSLWVFPQYKLKAQIFFFLESLPGDIHFLPIINMYSLLTLSSSPSLLFSSLLQSNVSTDLFVSMAHFLTWQFQPSLSRGNFQTPTRGSCLAPGTFLGNTGRQMLSLILETGSYI